MASDSLPSSMKAWQYDTTTGGLEKNLHINHSAALPQPKADCHLVRVVATSLNAVDYKLSEIGFINRFVIKKPATPGLDIVGRVVVPASGSAVQPGQLIFGGPPASDLTAGRGLAQFANMSAGSSALVPETVSPQDAGSIVIAASTAWQCILPHVKPGSRLFINGGSGGVGTMGIQLAKIHGCHVTCSCSSANIALCKSLGADEVIDYKKGPVTDAITKLAKDQKPYDHVVDFVGLDFDLFWKCHKYTTASAKYISIAATPSLAFAWFTLKANIWPAFLGGAQRKLVSLFAEVSSNQLEQMGKWMAEGRLKAVIDEAYPFEQAVEAFRKLKTGRVRGKIVVLGVARSGEH